jgi:hypothetical protein
LSLKVEEMPSNDPQKSIQNGLMYLNKILETSPYLRIHQFIIDSYLACTEIGQHVSSAFHYNDSTVNIKNQLLNIYEEFMKWEVEQKEASNRNYTVRAVNTVIGQPGQVAMDPYTILGIKSLENGGSVTDWDDAFENKMLLLLADFELGLIDADEIFHLAENSDKGGDD